jgi:pentatricopeptide repeat protein
VKLDYITFINLLNVCASSVALTQRQWLHIQIVSAGLEVAVLVGNAVNTMFVKCGNIQDACEVFDNMKVSDVISWSAMSEGYAEYSPYEKMLDVIEQMQSSSVKPDMMTFIGHFKACANQCCVGIRICYRYPMIIHPDIYPLTQQG